VANGGEKGGVENAALENDAFANAGAMVGNARPTGQTNIPKKCAF